MDWPFVYAGSTCREKSLACLTLLVRQTSSLITSFCTDIVFDTYSSDAYNKFEYCEYT